MSIARLEPIDSEAAIELDDSALCREFLSAIRGKTYPVIAVNERLLLANEHASVYLEAKDHARLWGNVLNQVRENSCSPVLVTVPGLGEIPARCVVIGAAGRISGVVLTLDRLAVPRPRLVEDEVDGGVFPGSSGTAERVRRQIAHLRDEPSFALITGESGSGKAFVAQQILAGPTTKPRIQIIDARACRRADWLEDVRAVFDRAESVVLTHLDELDPAVGVALAEILQQHAASARVIATAITPIATCNLLDGLFPGRLHLPPLREHREDIPAIVDRLLRGQRRGKSRYRLSANARGMLWANEWAGNVAELRGVIESAIDRSATDLIEAYSLHLPKPVDGWKAARSGTFRMEERQLLVDAMAKANNNKLIAAAMLGIARSTLYRKLKAFDISGK